MLDLNSIVEHRSVSFPWFSNNSNSFNMNTETKKSLNICGRSIQWMDILWNDSP